jgi:hypothetical protein
LARRCGLGTLLLALLLAGCRVAGLEVTQRVSAPVRVVSLEIDPTPPYNIGPEARDAVLNALHPGLVRYGIRVVDHGQEGAPALIGQVEYYDPGGNMGAFTPGEFRARWRLVDASGVTLGECRTDAKTRNDIVYADFYMVMEDTGYRLGQFLWSR